MSVIGEIIPFTIGEFGEEILYKKSEKQVLGTVANIRYYHLAAPWDAPLSFGVQAFIEYNGLVLNDRYQSDLIRVTSITGLDDAEIRDSREPRPGKSGEFAYAAFYGGRNLVINGFIEAGTLAAEKTLEKNLKAAFAPLEESQLKLRWFDIYDPFDDPNTILEYNLNASLANIPSGNYSAIIGNTDNLVVENGFASWKTAGNDYLIRAAEKRTFCDAQATLGVVLGYSSASSIGVISSVKDEHNFIKMMYYNNTGNPYIAIESVFQSEPYVLAKESLPIADRPIVGQQFWLRGRKEGNRIIVEFWLEEPNSNLPTASISYNLTGEEEEIFGDEILAQMGFGGDQVDTSWKLSEFKIESIYPGDIEFQARKLSPISIKDEQTSLSKFKRPFQIVMKTSDFRALSSTEISKSITPTSVSTPLRARKYPRSYPLAYKYLSLFDLPLNSNILSVNNRGSVYVEPIMYLYSPGENIIIENLTNGQSMEWLSLLGADDYLVFDCKEETLTNSLGTNLLEFSPPTIEWIRLEPEWNDIYIQGSGFTEETKFEIKWRHGYM